MSKDVDQNEIPTADLVMDYLAACARVLNKNTGKPWKLDFWRVNRLWTNVLEAWDKLSNEEKEYCSHATPQNIGKDCSYPRPWVTIATFVIASTAIAMTVGMVIFHVALFAFGDGSIADTSFWSVVLISLGSAWAADKSIRVVRDWAKEKVKQINKRES